MLHLVSKGLSGKLPTSEFVLMEDDVRVGMIQIRHQPSRSATMPVDFASHIYYEIDPAFRGKGYGKKILELGLAEARNIGLREVIITCDASNVASRKIIEANDGELVSEAIVPETGKTFLKFAIRFVD